MLSMLTLVQKANEQDQSSYIFRYKFGKSLNTLASNNVSLWTYKIMSFIKISKSLQTLFACLLPASVISCAIKILQFVKYHFSISFFRHFYQYFLTSFATGTEKNLYFLVFSTGQLTSPSDSFASSFMIKGLS